MRGPNSWLLAAASLASPALSRDAFVFLGATGDNALRDSGVWAGLFEAFAGGVFDRAGGVDLHVAMNTPHTVEELHSKVLASLTPLYTELQTISGWACHASEGGCAPEKLLRGLSVNIWAGRDANAQAANMTASLSQYEHITVYLSLPSFTYASWAKAAIDNWGKERVHVAVEKPFGDSLQDADTLVHDLMDAGMSVDRLHLVDHWLSFFMLRNLPAMREIIESRLGVPWTGETFEEVVVTEFETRGLAGRGGFFDKVGQVRDMVQSHLLQVMALTVMDAATAKVSRVKAKMDVFSDTAVESCALGQYAGFLFEPKLSYHPQVADSTYCNVSLYVDTQAWDDVPISIATGKSMGSTKYTIELRQRSGPGLVTIEVGKEETSLGGIRVSSWPLANSSEFVAPAGGFDNSGTIRATPDVSLSGTGYILKYDDPGMYFPKPYANMAAALLTRDYGSAFVTYPECQKSWEILEKHTSPGPAGSCLDPEPEGVPVYDIPEKCGHVAPDVCWENTTVEDLYVKTFSCTPEHDKQYVNVSLYQAKCHKRVPIVV